MCSIFYSEWNQALHTSWWLWKAQPSTADTKWGSTWTLFDGQPFWTPDGESQEQVCSEDLLAAVSLDWLRCCSLAHLVLRKPPHYLKFFLSWTIPICKNDVELGDSNSCAHEFLVLITNSCLWEPPVYVFSVNFESTWYNKECTYSGKSTILLIIYISTYRSTYIHTSNIYTLPISPGPSESSYQVRNMTRSSESLVKVLGFADYCLIPDLLCKELQNIFSLTFSTREILSFF